MFFRHKSAQICAYEEVLLAVHAIKLENQWRKMFLVIVVLLTMFIILLLLPTGQDIFFWFLAEGSYVRVAKYDVNCGISLDFP